LGIQKVSSEEDTLKSKLLYCLCILTILTTGCSDQIFVEDVSLTLILGIDLDEKGQLVVYMVSPVFSREAKTKRDISTVRSNTIRGSREDLNTTVMGLVSGSKTQIILVGKRLLKQKYWTRYLDPFYRDPKNTVTPKIVAVDDSVKELIYFNPQDKPGLPLYLTKLIESAAERNVTVKTNLQEFHEQLTSKAITASICGLKKTNKVWVTGSVLLDDTGKYKLSITPRENLIMRILQRGNVGEFPFTISIPIQPHDRKEHWLSFSTIDKKVKTKVMYDHGYIFDVNIKLRVGINERLFPVSDPKILEKGIETTLKKEFDGFIKKIQTAEIDPIGFGRYARAYTYPEWKKVQNHWGKTFSNAKVNVKVNVMVSSSGTVK
jgi:Ger(x)C family germination protein